MRVLVISGSAAFATIAETGGHEVLEARLGDAHAWSSPDDVPTADVVLVDIPDAALASTVSRLVSKIPQRPAQIVVEGSDPEWQQADLDVEVSLQPPLGRDTVLAAIGAAWGRRNPNQPPPPAAPPTPSLSAAPATLETPAAPLPAPVPPRPKAVERPSPSSTRSNLTSGAEELAASADEAATVTEVATTLCAAAAEMLDASAAALLCPDDGQWSVVGGFGTRSLELRVSLPPEHWLIEQLLTPLRGAVVDRSDVIRSELTNAPLASRDHLVIVCDGDTRSMLMVGRDDDAFHDQHIAQAHALLREASPLIAEALALHQLAQSLARFRDLR